MIILMISFKDGLLGI